MNEIGIKGFCKILISIFVFKDCLWGYLYSSIYQIEESRVSSTNILVFVIGIQDFWRCKGNIFILF